MIPLPDLLTVEEAAEHLRRSEYHVRYLLRTQKLVGRKLATHGPWLIPADQIRQTLEGVAVRGERKRRKKNQPETTA